MRELLERAGYTVAACEIDSLRDVAATRRPLVIVLDAQWLVRRHPAVLDALNLCGTAGLPVVLTSKVRPEKLGGDATAYPIFMRPVNREALFLAIHAYHRQALSEDRSLLAG